MSLQKIWGTIITPTLVSYLRNKYIPKVCVIEPKMMFLIYNNCALLYGCECLFYVVQDIWVYSVCRKFWYIFFTCQLFFYEHQVFTKFFLFSALFLH